MKIAGLVCGVTALVVVAGCRREAAPGPAADWVPPEPEELIMDVPGVRVARLYDVREVNLPDDFHVTGVVVAGEARAYLEAGMSIPETHIAFDRFAETHVAVVFCNRTGCTRVFTGAPAGLRQLRVGGWKNDNMQMLIGDEFFPIDSPEVALRDMPFQTVTWGEWRRRYPATKLYLGDQAARYGFILPAEISGS